MAAAGSENVDVLGTKVVEPLAEFVGDARDFISRCAKPKFAEMREVSSVVGVGFLIMGVIGFFVRLLSMPLNQILMS